MMRRLLDIFFSVLALVFLFPLFAVTIFALRLTGEGEVFFTQERIGKYGRTFRLLKFATMLKDSPNMGTGTVTMKGDPRILPFGKLLRDTKINELPQLINILLGDMSLIGPRPLTAQAYDGYLPEVKALIQQVRPGLSGIGSIVFHNEEEILADNNGNMEFYRNVLLPYKGKLESWYVGNQGLGTYVKAIFLTVWVVFFHEARPAWRLFKGLPIPPENLRSLLSFDSSL